MEFLKRLLVVIVPILLRMVADFFDDFFGGVSDEGKSSPEKG